jgi:hypothetical protein
MFWRVVEGKLYHATVLVKYESACVPGILPRRTKSGRSNVWAMARTGRRFHEFN